MAPLDPNIRKAMGVSRGRWEGNTLVVEVTNFTNNFENNWVIGAVSATPGIPAESLDDRTRHSTQRSVQGHRALHADRCEHDPLRSDDHGPKVFTQPWTIAWYAFARAPKDYVPVEYACFEGNDKNLMLMTDTDISGVRVNVP